MLALLLSPLSVGFDPFFGPSETKLAWTGGPTAAPNSPPGTRNGTRPMPSRLCRNSHFLDPSCTASSPSALGTETLLGITPSLTTKMPISTALVGARRLLSIWYGVVKRNGALDNGQTDLTTPRHLKRRVYHKIGRG